MTIFLMSGCSDPAEVALTSDDKFKARDAAEKITDQSVLIKIALEAGHREVRLVAVKKLTDQSILTKIALDTTEDHWIRGEALDRVTDIDQTVLEKLFLEGKNSLLLSEIAFSRITDPKIFTKIALEEDKEWRNEALEKLSDPSMLAILVESKYDKNSQLIYKFIIALDGVPDDHRTRLINIFFPVIKILNETRYRNKFGEIVAIKIDWSSKAEQYIGPAGSMTLPGESIDCSIKLMNLSMPLSHSWSTYFPKDISTTQEELEFKPAEIKASDLYGPVLKHFSQ